MALTIKHVPVLKKKASERFLEKMEETQTNPKSVKFKAQVEKVAEFLKSSEHIPTINSFF